VLLIEHDVKLMMGLCDRITVLNTASASPKACRPKYSKTRR
jgi:ABC-type branched-subunit amino acid transport system ATPase component